MMLATAKLPLCSSCRGRLARDQTDTICSPCRRAGIEHSANRESRRARDHSGIKEAFDSAGLYGVADHLDCTPEEAMDVLISSRLFPFISARRHTLLHQLVGLRGSSHVAVAEALHISRWTVATYRHQLGIDRAPAPRNGRP
ncbi:MAG: hypothetical protein ACXVKP_06410 [Ilumatobacteraceae bacterium]